jgi:hypothetical protein
LLTIDQLKTVIHRKGISRTDVALLCVAAGGGKGVPTTSVREYARQSGMKGHKEANFSAFLSQAKDKVFKTPDGWELTADGRTHVAALAAHAISSSPAAKEAETLRKLIPKLNDPDAQAFLTEAIVCAEQSLFRAAVVLSWEGAVSLLYGRVLSHHLAAFNAEAVSRNPKWKPAKTVDDLSTMKESIFLEVLQVLSIIGKNVKQELDDCLRLRNGCGHPNSLKIGANKVAAHLETLALNVYAPFA